ncbi:chemotaxis protein CheC [Halobellus salinus]|uniref:Chemotaxis protein CheC n=1 Tax=Halobellus salinus TaxID=931585 RepID=A0A830E9P8_9EURY|nr:chemotaxis protein CheC [Halobellus salinus]GGJ04866.1 chemotaxis protein CheC [Halobellus salinus]SMP09420.1 two-component system, chemotaxis family, sensor kinase CheA/chemotaxis protein CheC [Halobellus salinus]
MNLDVESLRTFSSLAHSGAEEAADSLSTLTGFDSRVAVTKVEMSTRSDVEQEFCERDLVSVHIGFSGAINGRTVLAFDRDRAVSLVDSLVPGASDNPESELATSGLKELGNIMLGGFIDGWADFLGEAIDITTPTYVELDADRSLVDVIDAGDDATGEVPSGEGLGGDTPEAGASHVLAFQNHLETVDEEAGFYIYMLPTRESVGRIVDAAGDADDALPVETFTTFSQMITEGAGQASEDLTAMTGIDTDVDVSRLSFVPIEGVPMQLTDETRRGVVLEFTGTPSGYIAILFDPGSAESVADALMPGMDADPAMRKSAIQEIGNIVTSGFLDGWADSLETTIDISPPTYVDDIGSAIVDPLVAELAQTQEYAFLIDSAIATPDETFTCDIYALPDEQELRTAFERLAPEPS